MLTYEDLQRHSLCPRQAHWLAEYQPKSRPSLRVGLTAAIHDYHQDSDFVGAVNTLNAVGHLAQDELETGVRILDQYVQWYNSLDHNAYLISMNKAHIEIGDYRAELPLVYYQWKHYILRIVVVSSMDQQDARIHADDEALAMLCNGNGNWHGILYLFVRKKAPAIPEVLKTGGLTRRKNIDTTWAVYRQAVLNAGYEPRSYQDMRDLLVGKEISFFQLRVRSDIPRTQVDAAYGRMVDRVRGYGAHESDYLNPHPHLCPMCPVSQACIARERGDGPRSVELLEQYAVSGYNPNPAIKLVTRD